MAVSKRLRYEILRRDNHTCRYCGASAPDVPLRVDHVTPVALGGTDTPDNLVTSCEPCNSGKSSATVDSAVVAGVSDDALRWAAAMTQASDNLLDQETPKLEYRDAFLGEWNRWGHGKGETRKAVELPGDWKASVERFRIAGLPIWMWADIVDASMGNEKVLQVNKFKYCCGIAWNRVTELQDEARRIVGAAPSMKAAIDSVAQAALDVWAAELNDFDDETRQSILTTAQSARERGIDAHLILEAAQYAAWFGLSKISDATAELWHDRVMSAWQFAWLTVTGDYPDETRTKRMVGQVDKLLGIGVHVGRLERAATYAGSRRSVRLYFGLSEEELKVTGESDVVVKAAEVWSQSFYSSAGRWPDGDEITGFFKKLWRVGDDGDMSIGDIYPAAAAAGLYQDPDLSTCITRHLSVFEIAARPMGGGN